MYTLHVLTSTSILAPAIPSTWNVFSFISIYANPTYPSGLIYLQLQKALPDLEATLWITPGTPVTFCLGQESPLLGALPHHVPLF